MKLRIAWQMSHSTRSSRFLRWSRNVFFVIGILALGYCGYAVLDAKIYQGYQTQRFQRAAKEAKSSSHMGANVIPPATVPSPVQVTSPGAASFGITGRAGSPLGQIEIPKIGLAVMILEGTDNRTLRRAVGHIPETALPGEPGNIAIAGHRDTFFRHLRDLEKNDEITLTTLDNTYRYLVDFSEVVGPNDTEVLNASDIAILTLVTCYPPSYIGPAPKRLIVRAHMIPEPVD
ncbi:MAG: class D sortase [Acidobacteriia bacterium]|nr:class D sortase [Terriglobia bacterium]